jgi:hypothetical protein
MHALYQRDTRLGKLKTLLCNKGTNLFVPKTTKKQDRALAPEGISI